MRLTDAEVEAIRDRANGSRYDVFNLLADRAELLAEIEAGKRLMDTAGAVLLMRVGLSHFDRGCGCSDCTLIRELRAASSAPPPPRRWPPRARIR